MRFAQLEQTHAEADAAPGLQQDALAEIEELPHIQAAREERRLHIRALVAQRQAGGGADRRVAGEDEEQGGPRYLGIARDIGGLAHIPLEEVRPVVENLHMQALE